jgi:hypothetical protein
VPVGPGTLEVTVIPGGTTHFTSSESNESAPHFGSYSFGGSLTYNLNRFVGIEGEVGAALGIAQDLEIGAVTKHATPPNLLNYSGSLVFSVPAHSVAPYLTAGVGGLTMFDRPSLGISDTLTFLTGNVGGGLKWYAPNGRWGLRGDYRYQAVASKDDAPAFVGRETRYIHRVYAGVVINAVR